MPTYAIDAGGTQLSFTVRGLRPVRTEGTFEQVAGTIFVDEDGAARALEVLIAAESLRTGLAARDLHLRSAGFLNARRYPVITYTSREIEQVDPNRYLIRGALRLRGREHPVTLAAVIEPEEAPDGARRGRVSGVVPRAAFGIPRNPLLRALMPPLIGDAIAVTAEVRAAPMRQGGNVEPAASGRPEDSTVGDQSRAA
jgi:polyisoprenoid-binding protein YceI